MLDLFLGYRQSGRTKQALLAGQNMVNRNPGDKACFEAYFDYLVSLARDNDMEAAKSYLQQADGVLAFFAESVVMDESTVAFIIRKEEERDQAAAALKQRQEERNREAVRQEVIYHNDALALIEQLLQKIQKCEKQSDFNTYVNDLGRIDQSINRGRLSERQESRYLDLTQKSSYIVSAKMAYFENVKNREYNMAALEAYEKVFRMFKDGRMVGDHKEAIKSLFMFDASRLYNETLVYYNHVYNYILSQLNDEDKFIITKYAVMCERKR